MKNMLNGFLVLNCVIAALVAPVAFAQPATTQSANVHPPAEEIIKYLDQVIEWYRRVQGLDQGSGDAGERLLRSTLNQNAQQVVQLAFQFANAEAVILERAERNAPTASNTMHGRNVVQESAKAKARADRFKQR